MGGVSIDGVESFGGASVFGAESGNGFICKVSFLNKLLLSSTSLLDVMYTAIEGDNRHYSRLEWIQPLPPLLI